MDEKRRSGIITGKIFHIILYDNLTKVWDKYLLWIRFIFCRLYIFQLNSRNVLLWIMYIMNGLSWTLWWSCMHVLSVCRFPGGRKGGPPIAVDEIYIIMHMQGICFIHKHAFPPKSTPDSSYSGNMMYMYPQQKMPYNYNQTYISNNMSTCVVTNQLAHNQRL